MSIRPRVSRGSTLGASLKVPSLSTHTPYLPVVPTQVTGVTMR